ncbi:MAG: hypothetical protein Kow00114_27370 [Kiloniellaceae bacterium]
MKPSALFPFFPLGAFIRSGADTLPFPAPIPERQRLRGRQALPLGTPVRALPACDHPATGRVYAVVHSRPPRYDVRADDGRYLRDLPADRVERLR